jgi:uncharacterized protein YdeI (YjbR/CyaY-like superfamily)
MPKKITVYNRADFRRWLKKNHHKEKNIAIVLYKRHTGKAAPTHRELMEEAICFGWIDTILNRLDDDRYIRNFCARNKNSRWSNNTLSYAEQLIKDGLMMPNGMKYYKLGKQKPTHDHGIPKNPRMPKDLKKTLEQNKLAKQTFDSIIPSKKKMIYRWILRGKLASTREKRISLINKEMKAGNKNFM